MIYSKVLTTAALTAALALGAVLPTGAASAAALAEDNSDRISGSDRYQTSLEVSGYGWGDNSVETVVVATGADFPDALAAAPLAGFHYSPLLLTKRDSLPAGFAAELKRLGAENVILVGGTGAISENVKKQITDLGVKVERISGKTRYETAVNIAEEVGKVNTLYVATGANFADSLSVSPAAALNADPILLVPANGTVPAVVADYIKENQPELPIIIGGKGAVKPAVEELFMEEPIRLAGATRYETNKEFNEFALENELLLDESEIFIATGANYPDALSGSSLAASYAGPLVLTAKTPSEASKQQIKNFETPYSFYTILGGEGAVSSATLKQLFAK
ncbi:cell wall-binding repeat-containing protein [Planococcus sp. CP5-4]|uniref:cell wall-binding repeat-containing protein n=1 Tax=unclassified Planococcus (in: firmicutes) TaxID=2662419 RepID=UPI001C21D7DB|nr:MULTISPECIES: cell wall-binding repeat-containing protein [unclassified Planococcus (in: firmicutes)]MBU9673295.1 cell wall-binding repeat-containing protein [Planococcus sp. CP5-4_YE]MBV0908389.1 cell wall-binding repeat-containing protein [Planococcus sp. CP5-4_UN]MBW6062603.1 cell wall-binding repeat-containing protein [Planococcus sp. CP5-4]